MALAVDSPELFNQIEETFCSQASMRFIILLWGKKSSLGSALTEKIPVFTYMEIIDLGKESRRALLDDPDAASKY